MKSSWFLSFISGQLKSEDLENPDALEQLLNIDFEIDDKDDLWNKKSIKQAYTREVGGEPDKKLFEEEYDGIIDKFKNFELKKTIDRHTPKYEGGGTVTPKERPLAMRPVYPGSAGVTQEQAAATFTPMVDKSRNAYQMNNAVSAGSKSDLTKLYTPEELAYSTGRIWDDELNEGQGGHRKVDWKDRLSGMVVRENDNGEFILDEPKDGEDIFKGMQDGSVLGTIGIWGPREKNKETHGIVDTAAQYSRYIGAGVYNTLITGIGKGTNELAMAANSFTGLPQDQLENVNTWMVTQAYRPAENEENSFGYQASQSVSQILAAMGASIAMSKMGIKPSTNAAILNTALTLYGGNEMFHQSRAYGLNDKSAALIYGGQMALLFQTNRMVSYLTKNIMPKDVDIMAREVYKKTFNPKLVKAINNGVIKESAVSKALANTWDQVIKKYVPKELASAAGEEATQEVFEAGIDYTGQGVAYAAAKYTSDLNEMLGFETGNELTDMGQKMFDENFKLTNIGENLFNSALYGAIGGAAGGVVNKFTEEEDKVPSSLLNYLVKSNKGDFNENYGIMRSVLEKDYKAGTLASTKIGINRTTKKVEAVTEKNKGEIMTLNEFFYKTQLQDLEVAKQSWDNSGINETKDFLPKFVDNLDAFNDFKLSQLQKKLMNRKVQDRALSYINSLRIVDNQINAILQKRSATDTPEQAKAYDAKLKGGTYTHKNKYENKKTKKIRYGKEREIEVTKDKSLEWQRDYYRQKIADLRSGEIADEMYQGVMAETEIIKIPGTGDIPNTFKYAITPFNNAKGVAGLDNFNSVNATMQYAVDEEQARIDAENILQEENYLKATEKIDTEVLPVLDADIDDIGVESERLRGKFVPVLEWIQNALAYGVKTAERTALNNKVEPFFDNLITKSIAKEADLQAEVERETADYEAKVKAAEQEAEDAYQAAITDWGTAGAVGTMPNRADFVAEEIDRGLNDFGTGEMTPEQYDLEIQQEKTKTIQKLQADAKTIIDNAQEVLPKQLDARNNILRELYTKSIETLSSKHKQKNGKQTTRYNKVSGSTFMRDEVEAQEAKAAAEKDEYMQVEPLVDLLKSIDLRLAQAYLNKTANAKANKLRETILPELVDITDSDLSSVEKILESKRLARELKTREVGGIESGKVKESKDFTTLSEEDYTHVATELNALRDRVVVLKTLAETNTPSYAKVRLKEDFRYIWGKAELVAKLVNAAGPDENELPLDDTQRAALNNLIAEIQSAVGDMFEDKLVTAEHNKKLVAEASEQHLEDIIGKMLEVDYQIHKGLIEKPKALSLFRPKDKTEMNDKNSVYSYLKGLAALNPYEFLEAYSAEMEELTMKDHISSYMQMDGIQMSVGLMLTDDTATHEFFEDKRLTDQIFISGIQGSGKTQQMAKVALNVWERVTGDLKRINPGARDEVIDDFISKKDGDFFTPYLEGDHSVYATYKKNGALPIVRASQDLDEKKLKGIGLKNATIKKITGKSVTPVDKVSSGDHFYVVSDASGNRTIYTLGKLPAFGSSSSINMGDVLIERTKTGKQRILALSKYQLQAKKLAGIIGSSAKTLPDGVGDNQIQELISMLKHANENNVPLEQDIVVFDEATLINGTDLMELNEHLWNYNRAKRYQKTDIMRTNPLKIVYLGDTKQVGEPNGLRGKVSVDTSVPGEMDDVTEHIFAIDKTPELTFTFRTGVKDIFDMVSAWRDKKYNNTKFKDYKLQTKYFLGDKQARGMQVSSPEQATANVNALIKALGENKDKISYIVSDRNAEDLKVKKQSIADKYGLLPTQVMSTKEAQGQDFEYVIVDLEEGDLKLNSIEDIIGDQQLGAQAVSAIGRAKFYSMIIMSPDKKADGTIAHRMESRKAKSMRDVQSYTMDQFKLTPARKTAYNKSMKTILDANRAKIVYTRPAAGTAPIAPYTGSTPGVAEKAVLDSYFGKNNLTFDLSSGGTKLKPVLRDDAGNPIPGMDFEIVDFTNYDDLLAMFNFAEAADSTTGQTDVKVKTTFNKNFLDEDSDPNVYLSVDGAGGLFVVPTADGTGYEIQQLGRILMHGDKTHLIPIGPITHAGQVTTLPGSGSSEMDLETFKVGFNDYHSDENALGIYVMEGSEPIPLAIAFDPSAGDSGKYAIAGSADTGIYIEGNTFTKEEIEKARTCTPTV